jgi:transcriptional regulator with XRE-family HTH domain
MSEYNIGRKIKQLRKAKRLTLHDVASETGFSTALISQIENDNISPPIATLSRLARFFDVRIGHFFSDEEDECRYEVVRAGERTVIPRVVSQDGTSHGYFYEALTRRKKNRRMDPFFLTLNDIAANTGTYCHDGEEFLFVMTGQAELILEGERIILNEGDAAYFDSTLKHRLLAHGGSEVKVMVVVMR